MAVNIGNIQKLTSPNPFALVSTQTENGDTNLMALSWWTYVSNSPATIAIALSSRGFSHERIDATQEFAINIVGESLRQKAFLCGTCSGRECDKAARFGIDLLPAEVIAAKVVKDTRAVMECKVVNRVVVGDHLLYIAEVVATHENPDVKALYAMNGYSILSCVD